MLDFTNIDAIQFLQDQVNNIRVYYQNADKAIRESCYDDKQKWYAAENTVTTLARANSPIAVSRWNGGTEIRVYYLDTNNKICETVGKSEVGGATKWEQGGDLSEAFVALGSQLGIARPGKDDSTLRVYYQEATTNKIREIMYWDDNGTWGVSSLEISGAVSGSRLSAVSAKPPGDIRLYYRGRDGNLKEHFFKQQSLEWSPSNLPPLPLISNAPICAVCWYADNRDRDPRDLRIRVFTIPQSSNRSVAQIVFNLTQGWNSKPTPLVEVLTSPQNYTSAIAACQTTNVAKGAISVFYQPESKVIDLKPVGVSGGNAALAEAKEVVTPRGIPLLHDILGSESLPIGPPQVTQDAEGRTQLHHAAINGDLATAQTIINSRATGFDIKDHLGHTPLFYAIANKKTSVAVLLAHKWNIPESTITVYINDNTEPTKTLALVEAIQGTRKDEVGFLIEIGANVNGRDYGIYRGHNATPLHEAALFADLEVIQMLLNAGANKRFQDSQGRYPSSKDWKGDRWSVLAI